MERTFDYVPRLVEANRNYRVSQVVETSSFDLLGKPKWWTPGAVLDQGSEGACVGFGCTAEATASPVRARLKNATAIAHEVYYHAQTIDEWEGENYEGTSVRAGMLVGQERGWWESFYWAFNISQVRQALELGPVVIGVTWLSGMYHTAAKGMVDVSGHFVGGHCLLITGYSPNYWGTYGPRFRWRNSWGKTYGRTGDGFITPDALNDILFAQGGECAVPVARKLVR